MSMIPYPFHRPGNATPCIPFCIEDHSSPGPFDDPGTRYCLTAAATVPCGTAGGLDLVEVASERYITDRAEDALPWRVTLVAPDPEMNLTLAAARELAWSLLGRADLIERQS